MTDKKPQVLVTQLKEKTDRNGNAYFIGDLAYGTISVFKHKSRDGVWNVFLSQKDFENRDAQRPKHQDDDGFNF